MLPYMGYSVDEINQAVGQLIRYTPQYRTDTIGARKVGTLFEDLHMAALYLLVSNPSAFYYVVGLGRDRVVGILDDVDSVIQDLVRLTWAASRTVRPVDKVQSLNTARAALAALARSAEEWAGGTSGYIGATMFTSFDKNSSRFLTEEGQKVVYKGDIVDTPEAARSLLQPGLRSLRSKYDRLIARAKLLAGCVDVFQKLNLPTKLRQQVLAESARLLTERTYEVSKATPTERLNILRSVVLDVLAVRAAVQSVGGVNNGTTIFALIEDTGRLFADSTKPALPATITAELGEGYSITEDAHNLRLIVDGIHDVTYPALGSFTAQLDMIGMWPREVRAGENEFQVVVESMYGEYVTPVVLPPATYTAPLLQDVVNAQLPLHEVEVVLSFVAPRTTQHVDVTGAGPSGVIFTAPTLVNFGTLGVTPGDWLYLQRATDLGYMSLYEVNNVMGNQLECTRLFGTSSSGAVDVEVVIGDGANVYPTLRLSDVTAGLQERRSLIIRDVLPGTCLTLSHADGAQSLSTRTPASVLRIGLNTAFYSWVNGAVRVTASSEFRPHQHLEEEQARSHPEDPTSLTFYKYRGLARVVTSGAIASFELLAPIPPAITDGGTVWLWSVIIREGDVAGDINNHGDVSMVAGQVITATMHNPLTTPANSEVLLEVGFNYAAQYGLDRADTTIRVLGDAEEIGVAVYEVVGPVISATTGAPLPFQVQVSPTVAVYSQPGGLPRYLKVAVGLNHLVIKSTSTSVDSSILIDPTVLNSAHAAFFTTLPGMVYGASNWVELPSGTGGIEEGDILEVHITDPFVPTITTQIVAVEPTFIKVSDAIGLGTFSSIKFTNSGEVPFARVRKKVRQNFDEMAVLLNQWLLLPERDAARLFRRLDAALNKLLVATTPSTSAVSGLNNELMALANDIAALRSALYTYATSATSVVDSLLKAYQENGADRAVDLLLSCDFAEFFGLGAQDASHTGYLQKQIREVEREDLPVRKTDRELSENYVTFDDYDPDYIMEE